MELATSEPVRARRLADDVLAAARRAGDARAVSMAWQALGLAARELGDVRAAVSHLRAAVAAAERAGLATRAAEARVSLAPTLQYAGRPADALREADRAAEVLRGPALARLQMQRAGILQRMGRLDEALALLRPAAAAFRRNGDAVWEARLLNNRGILHGLRGTYLAGDGDLRRAAELFAQTGDEVAVAHTLCNRGWLHGRQGDVPAALALYDESELRLRRLGVSFAVPLVDKCEVLLAVHLAVEARATAEEATRQLAAAGMASDVPDAQLKLAQAALLDGDAPAALAAANRAAAGFARLDRPDGEAQARWAAVRAGWAAGRRTVATQRAAIASAEALAAAGQAIAALDARLVAAQIAIHRRRADEAESVLAGTRVRRRAPAELRMRAWYAHALLRAERGNGSGTERALRAGWRLMEDYRASLGATELRVSVAGHGEDLARLGVAQALAAGRPDAVLRWGERARAAALRLRPVRPPDDEVLAHELAELREVAGQVAQAGSAAAATRLLGRQVALEESVRARARTAKGTGAGVADDVPTLAAVVAALDGRALLEILRVDGILHAVVVRDDRSVVRALGPAAVADRELEHLRFALRRLAAGRGPARSLAAAVVAARDALARLDELLLAPVTADIGDAPLVVSPPASLHALAWPALPSCRGRTMSVVASAGLWLRARGVLDRPPAAAPLLVAGPDLPHARAEIDALRVTYPGADVLVGADATAEGVGRRMATAGLAHVAAHGSFRSDNPLFSCLRLADGPFTVYDLEALPGTPPVLVLSACDSGLSAARPGDELMGLTSALFTLGTGALVASVGPVPDAATGDLMVEFHRRLQSGGGPARALAGATGPLQPSADPSWVAAASFVCFGAG